MDFARSLERDVDAFCRQGFGALLAKLAEHAGAAQHAGAADRLGAQLASRSRHARPHHGARRDRHGFDRRARGGQDQVHARTAQAPARRRSRSSRSAATITSRWSCKGNPLQLQNDDLVFEQANGPRTAALLANVSGTPLCMVEVAGKFGRELSAGEAAMVDFATELARRSLRRRHQEGGRQRMRRAGRASRGRSAHSRPRRRAGRGRARS